MPRERIFDEEIPVFVSTAATEACSSATLNRKLMLRIEQCSETNDNQKSFIVEVYDEKNVDFLYSGRFSRTRFEELKRSQRLKFSMEQAPKNIKSFVLSLREDKNRFVNCTIESPTTTRGPSTAGEPSRSVCRFELMCRSEFKEMSELTLELERAQGEQLNQHLIHFIDKYKRKAEEVPSLRDQLQGLQAEYRKLQESHKASKEELNAKIEHLEGQNELLLEELREKCEELQNHEAELETHQNDLKTLKVSYQKAVADKELAYSDNERFVADLDDLEEKVAELEAKLKRVSCERDRFKSELHTNKHQLRQSQAYVEKLRKGLAESEVEIATLQRRLKTKEQKHGLSG